MERLRRILCIPPLLIDVRCKNPAQFASSIADRDQQQRILLVLGFHASLWTVFEKLKWLGEV